MQGVQMVGRPEDGPGIEGAPLALLERVTTFLSQERAKLRTELTAANSGEAIISLPLLTHTLMLGQLLDSAVPCRCTTHRAVFTSL